MIAAAESSGCAAHDTSDVVVVDRPVADVNPKLGQFRGELHCYSAVPTELAQEVLSGGHGCTRCRVFDKVGHETHRNQSHVIGVKRFSRLARHVQGYPQTRCGKD
ncbi:hypothetical protein [Mesorhizobium sp. M0968]|uniref:hypothetical protein n=1 Tax=Mesorhizobium sp. M0968 TaxID=2957037 RepID=UPI0033399D27